MKQPTLAEAAISRTHFCDACVEALLAYRVRPQDLHQESLSVLIVATVVCKPCALKVLSIMQEWR